MDKWLVSKNNTDATITYKQYWPHLTMEVGTGTVGYEDMDIIVGGIELNH